MMPRHRFDLLHLESSSYRRVRDALRANRRGFRVAGSDDAKRWIEVESESVRFEDQAKAVVRRLERVERKLRKTILHRHTAKQLVDSDIEEALLSSNSMFPLQPGLIAIRGPMLQAVRFFEREFETLARALDADENRYPVLLPTSLLKEMKYFTHFPNQVTFCSHLPEDLPVLEEVLRAASDSDEELDQVLAEHLDGSEFALKPAVCLPCYPQQRGRRLDRGSVHTVSMQNHVFRYEGDNFRSLARMWDFSVRDIVFFGSASDLEARRTEIAEHCMSLCEALDLDATLQVASDPFFLDGNRNKSAFQRMGQVKLELCIALPQTGEELACSSFNLHRDFYTSLYDVAFEDGEPAESACMGFGLERWAYSFVSQKGLDPRGWPERARQTTDSLDAMNEVRK